MAWATIAEVKAVLERLGFDLTAWADAAIQEVIDDAQKAIERDCQRTFDETVTTGERHSGKGKNVLVAENYPIISLQGLTVVSGMGVPILTFAETHLDIDKRSGLIYLIGYPYAVQVFPIGTRNLSLDYTWGYATADLPRDLKEALIKLSCREIITQSPTEASLKGLKAIKILNYSETYNGVFAKELERWQERIDKIIQYYSKVTFR